MFVKIGLDDKCNISKSTEFFPSHNNLLVYEIISAIPIQLTSDNDTNSGKKRCGMTLTILKQKTETNNKYLYS